MAERVLAQYILKIEVYLKKIHDYAHLRNIFLIDGEMDRLATEKDRWRVLRNRF